MGMHFEKHTSYYNIEVVEYAINSEEFRNQKLSNS